MCSVQTGQLNEYTERKEMSHEVVCMGLAEVAAGEQRARFLAVGLTDNTVRIISLDPQVGLFVVIIFGFGGKKFLVLNILLMVKWYPCSDFTLYLQVNIPHPCIF